MAKRRSFPPSHESWAFAAVERILATDPALRSGVRTFAAMRGERLDFVEPTTALCPYLAMFPAQSTSDWMTEGQHVGPLVLRLRCVVAGSDIAELFDFWGAVRSALFPRDEERRLWVDTLVNESKINKCTILTPAYGSKRNSKNEALLAADGAVKLSLHILT